MRRLRSATLLCVLALGTMGCASNPAGSVRFHNRDPVWRVADRLRIDKPEPREPASGYAAQIHDVVRQPALHAMKLPEPTRAKNLNSLGEVPDSTWFENRIGRGGLSPEDVRRGPSGRPPLACAEPPITITRGKGGNGAAAGFRIEDARGERYLVKLDPPAHPELESGGDVVVQRLLWAAGYYVPDNCVLLVRPDRLVIAAGAYEPVADGGRIPLTRERMNELLARAPRSPDGERVRMLASKLLPGEPIGGYSMVGIRADDPNDRVPHQHRRDVRGQKVFFGWLAHTDVKESNTLDMWIEQPEGSGQGYVRHHLLDFGRALGGKALRDPQDAWAHLFDYQYAATSLVTFGLWRRPWENGTEEPRLRGVGRYDAEHYAPGHFRPSRAYLPFFHTDRFDAYWASKILMELRREHIEAAVSQGRYSDPRSAAYLVRTIIARQRETARHWFSKVNPVDSFRLERGEEGVRLCATDLLLEHGLKDVAASTRYTLKAYDYSGRPLGWRRRLDGTRDGNVCAGGLRPPSSHEGYTIVRVRTRRGTRELPPTTVHMARREGDGELRVIGIRRE